MGNFIILDQQNIADEHICCAFSDKKCSEGYALKKAWLKQASEDEYIFRRLDERAKVFMEYGPAEKGWVPVHAPNYLHINCFWVSGQYKEQGLETCDTTDEGFSLLIKKLDESGVAPKFNESVKIRPKHAEKGILVYYSDRCPYTDYHVNVSLKETAQNRNLPLKVMKLNSMVEAQSAPTPATIFSLFVDGRFITTDLSACMDSRFDKVMEKYGKHR